MFTPYLFSILGFYYIFLGCVGQGVKDKDLTPVLRFWGDPGSGVFRNCGKNRPENRTDLAGMPFGPQGADGVPVF